jgi:hypothetical protein
MTKTVAALKAKADEETAYRVVELGRRINDPPWIMAIYEGHLSACHDAVAEASRPPRSDRPCNTVITFG